MVADVRGDLRYALRDAGVLAAGFDRKIGLPIWQRAQRALQLRLQSVKTLDQGWQRFEREFARRLRVEFAELALAQTRRLSLCQRAHNSHILAMPENEMREHLARGLVLVGK